MVKYNLYMDINTGFNDSITALTEVSALSAKFERPSATGVSLNLINSRMGINYEVKNLRSWDVDFALDLNTVHKVFKSVMSQTTTGTNPYTHVFTPQTATTATLKTLTFALASTSTTKYYRYAIPENIRVSYNAGELAKFTASGSAVLSSTTKTLNANSSILYVYPHTTASFKVNATQYECTNFSVNINTGFNPVYTIGSKDYGNYDNINYEVSFTARIKEYSGAFDLAYGDDIFIELGDGTYKLAFEIDNPIKIYTKDVKPGEPDLIEVQGVKAEDFKVTVINSASS
jgi:hypothetical protein